MAKYKSSIEIQGAIGDLVYYQLNGVNVVRRKSGFNKTSYEEKESYAAVRQNSSEFGHCSKSGKMIREALRDYMAFAEDKYLYQKFAKVMTLIKDLDALTPKGDRRVYRGLKTELGKTMLREFEFGKMPRPKGSLKISKDLFETSLLLPSLSKYESLELIAITANFETYQTKLKVYNFSFEEKPARFALENIPSTEQGAEQTLYFAALRKNEDVRAMGFVF
ncbi:hypothetical protein [Chryseobacterium sp. A321]